MKALRRDSTALGGNIKPPEGEDYTSCACRSISKGQSKPIHGTNRVATGLRDHHRKHHRRGHARLAPLPLWQLRCTTTWSHNFVRPNTVAHSSTTMPLHLVAGSSVVAPHRVCSYNTSPPTRITIWKLTTAATSDHPIYEEQHRSWKLDTPDPVKEAQI
jgi:hypothetical protein